MQYHDVTIDERGNSKISSVLNYTTRIHNIFVVGDFDSSSVIFESCV